MTPLIATIIVGSSFSIICTVLLISIIYFAKKSGFDKKMSSEVEERIVSNEWQKVELSPKEYHELMTKGVVKPKGYSIPIIKKD